MQDDRRGQRAFFSALHGLRGLMAIWVVTYHFNPHTFSPINVTTYGWLAVDVFFIMSGYVLMQTHAGEFRALHWQAVWRFLRIRWYRTYPLYFVCTILAFALYPLLMPGLPGPAQVLASLLLLEGWALPGIGMNGAVWSLGVEWLGYLAFPFLCGVCWRWQSWAGLVLAGVVLAEIAAFPTHSLDATGVPMVVARMAGGFTAGCLLWTLHQAADRGRIARFGDYAMAGAVIGLLAILSFSRDWAFALPFLVLMVHGAAAPGMVVQRLLANRVALFLGRISFALYLSHVLLIEFARLLQDHVFVVSPHLATVVLYVVSPFVALSLCVWVEEPARRYGRRVIAIGTNPLLTPRR